MSSLVFTHHARIQEAKSTKRDHASRIIGKATNIYEWGKTPTPMADTVDNPFLLTFFLLADRFMINGELWDILSKLCVLYYNSSSHWLQANPNAPTKLCKWELDSRLLHKENIEIPFDRRAWILNPVTGDVQPSERRTRTIHCGTKENFWFQTVPQKRTSRSHL